MAKQSKNQIALQANEQALEKAKADLLKAQQTVAKLTQKIPELQRACESLRVLVGEKPKPKLLHLSEVATYPEDDIKEMTKKEIVVPTAVPPEIAAKLPVQDLTGIGSIPAPNTAPPEPEALINEDDENAFLPPITGAPVI